MLYLFIIGIAVAYIPSSKANIACSRRCGGYGICSNGYCGSDQQYYCCSSGNAGSCPKLQMTAAVGSSRCIAVRYGTYFFY